MSITNLLYVERDVGGTIKSSKKQFIWEFELDGKPQKIELYDSKWSGKKKIIKNGRVECEVSDQMSFFRSFDLNGHNCTIIQYGEKNELRIDNQSFSHLYNLERNKTFFSQDADPTSKSMQSKALPQSKANQYGINNNFYANSAPKDDKPALFNFNIKPVDQAHQPQRQFQFKSDVSSSLNPPYQQPTVAQPKEINLLGMDDMNCLPQMEAQSHSKVEESKSNTMDLFDVFANDKSNAMMNSNLNSNSINANSYDAYPQKTQFDNDVLSDLLGNKPNYQPQPMGGYDMGMDMNANVYSNNPQGNQYSPQGNVESSQFNHQLPFNSNLQSNQFSGNALNQNQYQQKAGNSSSNFVDYFS